MSRKGQSAMAGKHSKKPDTSDDQAKIEPASFWRRITELVPPWIAAAAAVVVAIAAVLALLATGTISSTSTPSVSSNGSQLTVTDAVNGGAWSRSDPTQGTLPTHVDRPTNAVAWIVNGRIVTPTCDNETAAYPV